MSNALPHLLVEDDFQSMSQCAAEVVLDAVRRKPNGLICVATGASPIGLYACLAAHRNELACVRILKLDEWGGLPPEDPATCETYIRRHILEPWGVTPDRYFGFVSNAPDPEAECGRIRTLVAELGGIDICILGMGADGHLGLNYPASCLPGLAHPTDASTLRHAMLDVAQSVPTHGLTLGLVEILQSREIVLVVNGAGKSQALARLLAGKITTDFPASLLWTHSHLTCVADQDAANA